MFGSEIKYDAIDFARDVAFAFLIASVSLGWGGGEGRL
jgi:hypothetical protein